MDKPTSTSAPQKRLYVDMDNVLTDFSAALKMRSQETLEQYKGREDEIPGLFAQMPPIPDAVEAMKLLANHYDIYILSTAPWGNPTAWSDKLEWVKKYLYFTLPGKKEPYFKKRLIISHHKDFNRGDYLIDDRPKNGAREFEGDWLRFKGHDSDKDESDQRIFNNWYEVIAYLAEKDHKPIDVDNLELIHENLSTTATREDLERAITDEFGVKYSDDGRRLLSASYHFRKEEYHIPEGVKVICDEAFVSCPDLKCLTIPDSVVAIGLNIFPYNGLERLECTSKAFEVDDTVIYPKGKTKVLASHNKTFDFFCVPDTVNEICANAFSRCNDMAEITIPSSVTIIGDNAFNDCRSLCQITLPESVTSIGDNAFNDCKRLKNITILNPDIDISPDAFSGCDALKTINVPKGAGQKFQAYLPVEESEISINYVGNID